MLARCTTEEQADGEARVDENPERMGLTLRPKGFV